MVQQQKKGSRFFCPANMTSAMLMLVLVACPTVASSILAQERAAPPDPGEPPAPSLNVELDKVDAFFGIGPKDKAKKAATQKVDDKKAQPINNQVQVGQAVIGLAVPMATLTPAVRVEVVLAEGGDDAADNKGNAIATDVTMVDEEKNGEEKAAGAPVEEEVIDANTSALARVLKVEIALIRRACQVNEQQEQQIANWNTKWLVAKMNSPEGKAVSKRLKMDEVDVNFNQTVDLMSRRRSTLYSLINDDLKTLLNAEQLASYEAERTGRDEFEKNARIDATVAVLDNHLFLTDNQRVAVRKEVSGMKNLMYDPINYLRYGNYVPHISLTSVSKHLSSFQRKILQSLQQVQFGVSADEDPEVIER